MKNYDLKWNNHHLKLGEKTCIMGIVNVTPDSFSDGGDFYTFENAVAQGIRLVKEGADILDVGGESTRPFSDAVSLDEEISRVVPVIEKLSKIVSAPISIDTTKAEVAMRAIEAGASIINDVAAFRLDKDIAGVAARYDVPVILMHMLGSPKTMQVKPQYKDLFGDITDFFCDAVNRAEKAGISRSKIIIDPGIGFGKTVEHNLQLVHYLKRFQDLDMPILVGASRKAFIRKILSPSPAAEIDPKSNETEAGTQAVVAVSILNGAHIVRVHDVAGTKLTVKIIDAIKTS
ncbi:MAG: dihydropteroate synthase [Desulfobacterales bacterium]|nr:dihydropteroate synthase [Desulfobacterales bacterium]